MGKKILFAVMALLVMATGKIWAQDTAEKKAYAVLYQNTENAIGSLYFMYTNEDVTQTSKTTEIKNGGSSDATTTITLTYSKHWEVKLDAGNPDWQAGTNSLTTDEKAKITEVVFEDSFKDVKVKSCYKWFNGFTMLAEIKGIENLDTSEVTNMQVMFYGCKALTSLDISSFNTSKVIFMNSMFDNCSSLKSLDISSFNTSSVTNMSSMFSNCSTLTSLDLSSFNTSSVTNMMSMFSNCKALTSLNLSSFNTSKVNNMDNMFYGCKALTSLDLSSFNTSSVTNMMSMFMDCKLTPLTLGSFDMSKVTNMNYMFGISQNNITIEGNALVFVTSDTQKGVWAGFKNNVKLMVKKDGAYEYEGDGTVDITLNNDEDTPVIFPHDFIADNVTFKRTFKAGNPHTVCLPFAVNATEYGTFYKLSSYDKDNRRVKFTKVEGATEANTPYLFIPDKDKADVTEIKVTGGVDISSTADETYTSYASNDSYTRFCGVYRKKTFTEQDLGGWYDYYGWTADGDFKKAGAGASVAPCRAYIRLTKETTGGSGSAPARLSVEFDDGETTGIDTIGTANGGADAPMYNLQGQRVSGGYKGVVIKNGKKMIVK